VQAGRKDKTSIRDRASIRRRGVRKRRDKKNEADAVASLRALTLHRLRRHFSVEMGREITLSFRLDKRIGQGERGDLPKVRPGNYGTMSDLGKEEPGGDNEESGRPEDAVSFPQASSGLK